jgi:hypothetical protein
MCGWSDLGGGTAKGMINQNTGRILRSGIWRLEAYTLQIGVDRNIRCQQAGKIRGRSRRQPGRTKRGNVDWYGFEFAGFVLFCVLACHASGGVSSTRLRHMAVKHSFVLMLCSGMEVKHRQTEEEQTQ